LQTQAKEQLTHLPINLPTGLLASLPIDLKIPVILSDWDLGHMPPVSPPVAMPLSKHKPTMVAEPVAL